MPIGRAAWIARHLGEERAAAYEVDPGPLAWLVSLWRDAGQARVEYTMSGGHLAALTWPDIAAWVEGAGEHDLSPTFRRAVMDLSAAYAETANAARELGCEAPYDPGKAT